MGQGQIKLTWKQVVRTDMETYGGGAQPSLETRSHDCSPRPHMRKQFETVTRDKNRAGANVLFLLSIPPSQCEDEDKMNALTVNTKFMTALFLHICEQGG